MSCHAVYYYTNLPSEVVDILCKDVINNFDPDMSESVLTGNHTNSELRKSQNF